MSRKNVESISSLAPAQQGMLYETISAPESGIHIEQSLRTFTGDLNVTAFEQAWQWVINRHAILRTSFVWKEHSEPLQVAMRQVAVPLARYDWRKEPSDKQRVLLETYLKEDRRRGFILSQAPLMRLALFQMADNVYQSVWTFHHILIDGWCHKLILHEVLSCYGAFCQGQDFNLEPSRPYKDYIAWLKQQDISKAEHFWRMALQGFVRPTPLGKEQRLPSLPVQEESHGSLKYRLSAATTSALQVVARRHHLTLSTLVQGVWALLLSRYSGTNDVVFGITVSGRPAELSGIETMVGLFINTLPLRIRLLPEASLWSWLGDIQTHNLQLRQYEYCPVGSIHSWSEMPGMFPLFESLLVVENYPTKFFNSQPTNSNTSISETQDKGAQTNYALTFLVSIREQLAIECIYNQQRFTSSAARQVLEHFQVVLQYLATDPEQCLGAIYDLLPVEQIPIVSSLLRESGSQAPRSPIEEVTASIWSELLGLEHIGIHDNFFELGGHSLLATQLISRVRTVMQVDIPLRSLFEAPTIVGLAEVVEQALRQGRAMERSAIELASREEALPLSFAQQRLWFLDQLEPESSAYNIPVAVRLRGTLERAVLFRSLKEIVRRHESLRTTFRLKDDQPVQVIGSGDDFSFPRVDLDALHPQQREMEVRRLQRQEGQQPFDLVRGPLLRTMVVYLNQDEPILLLTMHHIVSDGWSMNVFVREITTLYNAFVAGQPSPLPDLPIQYADFALWQRRWLQGEVLEEQIRYWREQLADLVPIDLPTDHPHPAVQTARGARQVLLLPHTLRDDLRALSQREGVTLFMTVLAAFQILLARYSGQSDIAVGTPIANRTQAEIEGLIGFFVNTLVLRTDLSGNPSFQTLLSRVRETCLGAYAHQDIPFEKLVEVLHPQRDLSRSPLFQVMLNVQQTSLSTPGHDLQGLTFESLHAEGVSTKFDLTLTLTDTPHGLQCGIEYNADLFEADTISHLLSHWQTLLHAIVANPHSCLMDLPLLSEDERHHLLVDCNQTVAPYPMESCIHELFEAQAIATPEALAVVCRDESLTYAALNRRANLLAHHLRTLRVGPDVLVGICLERSIEMIIGILGILKAGGAYVPLDPAYPIDRLALMLEDSQLSVLLTQPSLVTMLPPRDISILCLNDIQQPERNEDNLEAHNPLSIVEPEHLAYVIYTSGSTGRPKGIAIRHRAVVNFLNSMNHTPGITSQDSVLAVTSLSFDIAVLELLLPLTRGARVQVVDRNVVTDGLALAHQLTTSGITMMQATPTMWRFLLDAGWAGDNQLKMLCGGEALTYDLAQRLSKKGSSLWNMYGPTETTIWSTMCHIDEAVTQITIGHAIDNTQLYVLDHRFEPVPIGVPGELYIGGEGLARGYLRRPELSAEMFVPNAFSGIVGDRMYRTGDLVRYLPDRTIEYLRRADQQVKLRGFRIELGEIESVLQQHPGVHESVVLLREEPSGDRRLVAYQVGHAAIGIPSVVELRAHLQKHVPEYMVPSFFVTLAAMPLTPNGKLDRRALLAVEMPKEEVEENREGIQGPIEEIVAGVWKDVLGREQVEREGNFFTQGGHSLLATQLVVRLRAILGVEVPLRSLFEAPTLVGMSGQVERALRTRHRGDVSPLLPVSRAQVIPLSFAQQRLWFLDRLQPGSAAYNLPDAVRLHGKLDVVVLERCLREILYRHESLRTTFHVENDQPAQVIKSANAFFLPVIDLSTLRLEAREEQAREQMNKEALQPFDLVNGPVWRATVLRLREDEHVLLLTMHHIAADAWSSGIFVREVSILYEAFTQGKPSPLAPLPLQYADFAVWQRNWLQGEVLSNYIDYWRKQLRGAVPLELPYDHPRPLIRSYRGASYSFALSSNLSQDLLVLSHQEAATLFITLLTAFQTLMYRCTDQTDITVGTDIANRNSIETEGLIGFFINLLALRTNLSGASTFRDLLHQVRAMVLGAYTHQDIPFDMLVEHLRLDRKTNQTPLIQVLFVLQNVPRSQRKLTDLKLSSLEPEVTTAKFDMALFMREGPDGLRCTVNYSIDLFEADTIMTMMKRFEVLLHSIVAQPDTPIDALEIYTEEERLNQDDGRKERSASTRTKIKQIRGKAIYLK